nr:16S rRNA (cytidine(1402)-2'-O)-methyltransferase [Gammaproteobacteria bacterium]
CDSHVEKQLCENPKFIEQLKSDINIALVSDAGSPTISDPGTYVVALAHREGIRVIPVPGPCAVTAAISISGFSGARFVFGGYLPSADNDRRKMIEQHQATKDSVIFYETAQRIHESLRDLCTLWGADRQAFLARELTKQHQTLYRGTLLEIQKQLTESECKGEMVLVLEGANNKKNAGVEGMEASEQLTEEDKFMLKLLLEHLPPKTCAAVAAKIASKNKKLFYEHAIEMSKENTK